MAKTVLLIEDNQTIQHLVREACPREAFDVIIASEAADGIQKLQTLHPDIVLADATMPGINGFQLCQIIRATASTQQVPVVLLTSHFTTYDHAKGKQAGVTAHLTKPFEAATLIELLCSLGHEDLPVTTFAQSETTSPEQPLPPETVDTPNSLHQTSEVSVTRPRKTPQSPRNPSESLPPTATQPGADISFHIPPPQELPQAVGHYLLTAMQDICQRYVTTLLEQLTPEIMQTLQRTVEAKVPEVLEELLQREITRLRHDFEQSEGEQQPLHKPSQEEHDGSI